VRDGWKSNIVLWGNRYQAKKERIFLLGEVFFPLTPPLMGDPILFAFSKLRNGNIKFAAEGKLPLYNHANRTLLMSKVVL